MLPCYGFHARSAWTSRNQGSRFVSVIIAERDGKTVENPIDVLLGF
jgi:phosphotransferase system HPr-like phosphotransfer protein